MPPKNQATASRTAESSTTQGSQTQEELAAAQAEIAQLRAQLAAQTATPSRDRSPERIQLVTVLEAIAERLNGPQETVGRPILSKKLADPPPLDKGIEPTFASWKTQMRDKLEVNADHFPTTRSRMAYVFGRTTGDAQEHLHPRYKASATNPFTSEEDMISHLTSIYEDPFMTQNARLDYRSLMMKVSETFPAFQTRFLHLAGQAQIPAEDLIPDMFDKLTLDLQRAALPFYTSAKSLQELTNHCLALDQGLRRIKARSDRLKARTTGSIGLTDRNGPRTLAPTQNPPVSDQNAPVTPTRPATRTSTPVPNTPATPTRRLFNNPRLQALSDRRACFLCEQPGHIAPYCPSNKGKEATVQEVEVDADTSAAAESGSGKEEP
jgi:hypothetical protein